MDWYVIGLRTTFAVPIAEVNWIDPEAPAAMARVPSVAMPLPLKLIVCALHVIPSSDVVTDVPSAVAMNV
jgi:hypothetical protein